MVMDGKCHPHSMWRRSGGKGKRSPDVPRIDRDHNRWAKWKKRRAMQRASRKANR